MIQQIKYKTKIGVNSNSKREFNRPMFNYDVGLSYNIIAKIKVGKICENQAD